MMIFKQTNKHVLSEWSNALFPPAISIINSHSFYSIIPISPNYTMLYSLGSFDDTVDHREMKRSSSTMANGNKEQKKTYFAATHNQQTINIVDIVDDHGMKRSCQKMMISKNSSNKKRKMIR